MDIVQLGTQLLQNYLGAQGSAQTGKSVNADAIGKALTQLLGGSDGRIDLAGLVSRLSSNGSLQNIVGSWLGDGPNAKIDPAQIIALFGSGKIDGFAKQLGVNTDVAAGGLAATLPQLVDKFSSGGNLLQSMGGVEGLAGLAKKLF